jgi:hypothetical protein
VVGRAEGISTPPNERVQKLKVGPIALTSKDVVYAVGTLYCIKRDRGGTMLVCRACAHTERIQDAEGATGNPRTLAAQAMLKHVYAEHSREAHMRAIATVMERQRVRR